MTFTDDQILKSANTMLIYGGHFANAIGKALVYADSPNRQKLIVVFPELIDKYLKMGESLK